MFRRFEFTAFLFLIILLAVSGVVGCGSSDKTDQSGNDPADQPGRVINPDADWEPADDVDDTGDSGVDDDNDGRGGPPTQRIFEAGTVIFRLFVDGTQHPLDTPLEVYDRVKIDLEFHLTATGSELVRYSIETAARIKIPYEGILSGMNAKVNYTFTFDSRTWGDTGITIKVLNRNGDVFEANLPLKPAEIPGYNPR